MPTTISRSRSLAFTALAGLALVAAACSSSGASSAPSAAPSAAAPSAAASAAAGGPLTINVASGAPGSFLTGKDGMTLYVFTPDSANKSTCVDKCATTWPPLIVASGTPTAGTGVTGALTTFARADGTMQVAINGMPLYYYAADSKAGDTTGQGAGGKWFVASPSGAAPSAAPSASSGSRYNY